jgi:UDP-N-acetylmuramate dehydrogenase
MAQALVTIRQDHPLKHLHTFGTDVKATSFAEVNSVEEFEFVRSYSRKNNLPLLILGSGSNILFTRDYEGIVVKNNIRGIEILKVNRETVLVKANGGENWDHFVRHCLSEGLFGMENLAGIPGTVGATPVQNIGAYGVELKENFHSLQAIDLQNGSSKTFVKEDCDFGYRQSVFKSTLRGRYFIASVNFILSRQPKPGLTYEDLRMELQNRQIEQPTPADVADVVTAIRQRKLPDPAELGNAGSFFKNPVVSKAFFEELQKTYPHARGIKLGGDQVKVPAAWLIEQAGWKGKRTGNTGTSPVQPLVIVNYGGASGEEILSYALALKADVNKKFGVELEFEVNIL